MYLNVVLLGGECKIGISWDKQHRKYQTHCSNPFTGEQEYLGLFTDEVFAHKAWLSKKLEHAYALSELQTDGRVAKALIDRYENYS